MYPAPAGRRRHRRPVLGREAGAPKCGELLRTRGFVVEDSVLTLTVTPDDGAAATHRVRVVRARRVLFFFFCGAVGAVARGPSCCFTWQPGCRGAQAKIIRVARWPPAAQMGAPGKPPLFEWTVGGHGDLYRSAADRDFTRKIFTMAPLA